MYNIEDFTEENYRKIIKSIKEKYVFSYFAQGSIEHSNEHMVLMRHDIDYSINRAYRLAMIESEEGVKSTYFVHFHSPMYNPLESSQAKILRTIAAMGHHIGLHFDHAFYKEVMNETNDETMQKHAMREKEILENLVGANVNVVSFHNPEASNTLDIEDDYYAGMLNAYAKIVKERFHYCSDSNGYWRFERLSEAVEKGYDRLHILTHPVWWTPEEMTPYDRIKRCLYGRTEANLKEYSEFLQLCGRKNIGLENGN